MLSQVEQEQERKNQALMNHRQACQMADGAFGGFAAHLGRAFLVADNSNREALIKAFPQAWTVQDAKTLTKGANLRIKLGNRGIRLEKRVEIQPSPHFKKGLQWVLVTRAFYNQIGQNPLSIRGKEI